MTANAGIVTVHLAGPAGLHTATCDVPPADLDDSGPDRVTANRSQVNCTACTTADASPEPLLSGLAALRLARRVGIAHTRSVSAKDDYEAVKATAAIAFAQMRRRGIPNQEIRLPDGSKVAVISIEQGGSTTTINDDLLAGVAASNDATDFEDYVQVRAFTDRRVVALIAEHFPDLVGRRIKADALAQYKREIEENRGSVLNRVTGEREQVAEIAHHDPTGKFAVRFTAKGRQALLEALDLGVLNEYGESDDDSEATEAIEAALAEPVTEEDRARLTGRTGGDPGVAPAAGLPDDEPVTAPFFNPDGSFRSPEMAAFHAISVQGGFSTPAREARRMVKDGGPSAEMALAWLAERGLSVDGDEEPGGDQ